MEARIAVMADRLDSRRMVYMGNCRNLRTRDIELADTEQCCSLMVRRLSALTSAAIRT
jgi:hypothetical protein